LSRAPLIDRPLPWGEGGPPGPGEGSLPTGAHRPSRRQTYQDSLARRQGFVKRKTLIAQGFGNSAAFCRAGLSPASRGAPRVGPLLRESVALLRFPITNRRV